MKKPCFLSIYSWNWGFYFYHFSPIPQSKFLEEWGTENFEIPRNSPNGEKLGTSPTRISTWKMMRCRGKFLWILNWVKACSSQEFWEILSFTTMRLFWPLQEDFSCAVFRYKIAEPMQPPLFFMDCHIAEQKPCWVASLLKNWIALVLNLRSSSRTYRWPYVLRCIEMFLSSILGTISGLFEIFLKIFE